LVVVLATGPGLTQDVKPLKGVALVIGQSGYAALPRLPNSAQDARAIADVLGKLGLTTDIATDGKSQDLRRSIDSFIQKAQGADVAIVYYSGHAIEAGGVNYLLPTDTDLNALETADQSLVSLEDVRARLRQKAKTTILLLDACRPNPFPKYAVVQRAKGSAGEPIATMGLGPPSAAPAASTTPDATSEVIGFAAEPRQVAVDGTAGGNSPYAAALIKHLPATPAYDFSQVMAMVAQEVSLATQGRQQPWTSASLKQVLNFGGHVDESSDDAQLASERRKLLIAIADMPQDARLAVENLARDQGLPLDPLFGMLREMQTDAAADADERDDQLRAGAEALKTLLAARSAPLRKDPELVRLAGLADQALAQGTIELSRKYRSMAAARANDLDVSLDQRGPAAPLADRTELASIFGDYGDTAILASDYRRAAEQYRKALEQIGGRSTIWSMQYSMGQADALFNYGRYKGDDNAMRSAIAIYRSVVSESSDGRNQIAWAQAQSNLGNALQVLGDRTGDRDYAVNSVAAYQAALTQWTHDRFPLEWATAQNNLGSALRNLGENETGTETLTKAVGAFEAALTELRREQAPRDWAKAQLGLGTALKIRGERQNNTDDLSKSLAALDAALGQSKRERDPLGWGAIQYSMADALQSLGRIEKNTEKMRQAVATYQAALTELTPERVPQQWVKIQNSLGSALQMVGERDNDLGALRQAAAAYQAALTQAPRARSAHVGDDPEQSRRRPAAHR
jgi:uncharacterized caspase-like protein